MNRQLMKDIDEKTTAFEEKGKRLIKQHSKKATVITVIIVVILVSFMTVKGLGVINWWFDTYRLVTHPFITVQFHTPVTIERRKIKIMIEKVMVTPTPQIFHKSGDIVE